MTSLLNFCIFNILLTYTFSSVFSQEYIFWSMCLIFFVLFIWSVVWSFHRIFYDGISVLDGTRGISYLSFCSFDSFYTHSKTFCLIQVLQASIDKKSGYNSSVDIWSLGCTVIQMFTGKQPWSDLAPVSDT